MTLKLVTTRLLIITTAPYDMKNNEERNIINRDKAKLMHEQIVGAL